MREVGRSNSERSLSPLLCTITLAFWFPMVTTVPIYFMATMAHCLKRPPLKAVVDVERPSEIERGGRKERKKESWTDDILEKSQVVHFDCCHRHGRRTHGGRKARTRIGTDIHRDIGDIGIRGQ